MERSIDTRSLAGFVALAALVLLLSPGVRAVEAQSAAAEDAPPVVELETSPAGDVCRVEHARPGVRSFEAGTMARLKELVATSGGRAGAGDVQVLNGRGYNYGAAPEAVGSALLEFEARQQAREDR